MARRKSRKAGAPVVALGSNAAWNLLNYRFGLIRALQEAGYRLAALTPDGPEAARFAELDVAFFPVSMEARGTSPLADFATQLAFRRQLKASGAAAFLGFTAKPNIYGSIAARRLGLPSINNISGLGSVFGRPGLVQHVLKRLYRLALVRSATVFFQNPDDRDLFEKGGIIRRDQSALLPGSGVDLDRFKPRGGSSTRRSVTFLFAARLLWDKGAREFVDAARLVRAGAGKARFQILGFVEPPSPAAVPHKQLQLWSEEGVADYLGSADDVREALAAADCVVLPSYYREGVPRILLEAAAMGLPIITTDAPGCREAVDEGVSGLLCEPRSVDSLVAAMGRVLAMSPAERRAMGRAGRAKMENQFDECFVHQAYLDALARAGIVAN